MDKKSPHICKEKTLKTEQKNLHDVLVSVLRKGRQEKIQVVSSELINGNKIERKDGKQMGVYRFEDDLITWTDEDGDPCVWVRPGI